MTRSTRRYSSKRAGLCLGLALGIAGPATAQGLILNGDTVLSSGLLRLTGAGVGRAGSAWLTSKLPVVYGFDTSFAFQISAPGGILDPAGLSGADGFAFVIQNRSPLALGIGGVGIGYAGIPNSLAVEFDTWLNDATYFRVPDPNSNHISVHTRGIEPNVADEAASLGRTLQIPDLSDGRMHTARIVYTPPVSGQPNLHILVDGARVLAVAVDLFRLLNLDAGQSWVGFTAATGSAYANHDIFDWTFRVF